MGNDQLCYSTTIVAPVPSERAVAFLRSPEGVGTWALGTWGTTLVEGKDGVYVGRSLLDGTERSFFRVLAEGAPGVVEYEVGGTADALTMRVAVKVVAGEDFGYGADHCLVTLLGWRPQDMGDVRWRRLCTFHDVEILMIEARLKGQWPPGQGNVS
jgi:hypothetical protein